MIPIIKFVVRNSNYVSWCCSSVTANGAKVLWPSTLKIYFCTNNNDSEKKPPVKKTSKAMKAYLERARKHEEFIKKENLEYQIGKRHLANMMGEDPELFTQEDVNRAIEYLFPSGLFEPKARPFMKPPEEVFPPQKAAEFDEEGRPHHFLFYTGKANFYKLLYEVVENLNNLNKFEDRMIKKHLTPDPTQALNTVGSEWLPQDILEHRLVEPLHESQYAAFKLAFDRLVSHPYSYKVRDFIEEYRKPLVSQVALQESPELQYDVNGRPYITTTNCLRKRSWAEVTIRGAGSGKISINGQGLDYFPDIQSREQEVTAPLVRTRHPFRRTASPAMLPDDSSTPADGGGGGGEGGGAGAGAGVEERQRRVWAGRRALLDRAISMTAAEPGVYPEGGVGGGYSAAAAAARLNRTSSPGTKARWRHGRSTRSNRLTLLRSHAFNSEDDEKKSPGDRMQLGPSPPLDDDLAPLFESFERAVPEELRVRICRDGVTLALQEAMRAAAGSTALLDAIERGDLTPDSALDALAGKPALELNLALLWAALQRRRDLLPALLKTGASLDFCDSDGFSALHLAAFSGCADSCRFLVSMGADVNLMRGPFSPLHSAAFGNALDATRVLLDAGAVVEYWKRNGARAGDATALHSAVKANAVDVLRLLLSKCEDVNSVAPAGCAPLHLAADLGKSDCLRLLAEWEGVDLNVQTTEKSATALHLAAENGLAECVALLLARGADANVRNYRGQVPLHLAARAQSVECVETLLRASSCDVNVTDDDQRTPLHAAVGKALLAYEVAETLISWRADVNARDCFGYTPLHVAALNELAQCVETLLYHGADVSARTHGGTTALSIIVRKTPASLNTLYAKFDAAISMHDPEVSHREVELKLDFRQLLQHCERGEIAYLKTFVDEGQKEVLKHPLCEAFLHLKWQKIRKFYVVKLIFYFLFVLSLTLYVMSALAHNCFNEHYFNSTNASSSDGNRSDNSLGSTPVTEEPNKAENQKHLLCSNGTIGHFITDHPSIIIVEWYILLLFTFCEIFRKIFGFSGFSTVKEYVSQVENLLEWFVVISVFTISCVFSNRIYEWQNHIGAFAVLFGWWNLMHMLGQLPLLGSYVAMYTRVQREFLKLFAAYLCLLIGFTISFCVIFPTKAQFGNPFISFMKVLVMMTGELEFDSIFFDDNPTALPYSAHFIFIIFLLFATVVLMNLLVGIAVHDIQGLQKTAGLLKLEQQTRLISYVELALFNNYIPRFMLRCLQRKASVSPSAYRVVLHVKPLNPREKRLPRSILHTAYELAKQRKHKKHGTIASRFSSVTASTYTAVAPSAFSDGTLYSRSSAHMENLCTGVEGGTKAIAKLSEEVLELRGIVEAQRNILQEVLELVKKQKESDC